MSKKKHKVHSKLRRSTKPPGLPPGSLVYTGKFSGVAEGLSLIRYNADELDMRNLSEIKFEFPEPYVSWYNITGLNDVATVDRIGEILGLHKLLVEDILNTDQQPKVELIGDYIFVTLKMLSLTEDDTIEHEQVSFVLGENHLISFQEYPRDVFDGIRLRIKEGRGIVRTKQSDYLLYLLMDVIVDNYFKITDFLADRIEHLEDEIAEDPRDEFLREIQDIRKDLMLLRKSLTPLRDISQFFQRKESPIISNEVLPFYRDLSDHIFHANELIESYRDLNAGLKDMYLNSISLRMNRIMQILTVVSTIFIPLSFLVGVYGMNFQNMPELQWHYSYYVLWGSMILLVIGMLYYFKVKRWF